MSSVIAIVVLHIVVQMYEILQLTRDVGKGYIIRRIGKRSEATGFDMPNNFLLLH